MDKQFESFRQNLKVFGRRAGHTRDYVENSTSSYKKARELYPSGVRTSAMFIVAANEFIGHKDRLKMAVVTAKTHSDVYYGRHQNVLAAAKAAAEYYSAAISTSDMNSIVGFVVRQITQRTADANRNEAIGEKGLVNVVLRKLR